MKGVVFVEFIEMVSSAFSDELVDQIIDDAALPSEGSYTSVGTYDHQEMLDLVTALSHRVDTPVPDLVHAFGKFLLGRFVIRYPGFFDGVSGAFEFAQTIEGHIHEEVLKLYPEAELPTIQCEQLSDTELKIHYQSSRPFASLAAGLLEASIEHFRENIVLSRESGKEESETQATFTLTRL